MKPRGLVAVVCLIALASCSNSARDSDGNTSENKSPETLEPTSVVEKDARYGTVQGLMEAAVEAGYICKRWRQDDKVDLAAESGSCSGSDVFATYASDGDLQAQLDTFREFDEMFEEMDIESDPTLVGPNWTIKGTEGVELQEVLGGTVER